VSFSQVLNRSSDDVGDLITASSTITFLDEFRIMAMSSDNYQSCEPELVVFNTLVSQDHPGSFQRFRFPLKYSQWSAEVYPNNYRRLGATGRDGPLIVDPTQAVLIVRLKGSLWDHIIFAMEKRLLIERVCSSRTQVHHIPWEEWGGSTMAVMIVPDDSAYYPIITHGTRVTMFSGANPRSYYVTPIRTFDFSRRGRAALPLFTEDEEDETERMLVFEDKRSAFEWDGELNMCELRSLGDSILIYVLSPFLFF